MQVFVNECWIFGIVLFLFHGDLKLLVSLIVESVRMRAFPQRVCAHKMKKMISTCRYMLCRWQIVHVKTYQFWIANLIAKTCILQQNESLEVHVANVLRRVLRLWSRLARVYMRVKGLGLVLLMFYVEFYSSGRVYLAFCNKHAHFEQPLWL